MRNKKFLALCAVICVILIVIISFIFYSSPPSIIDNMSTYLNETVLPDELIRRYFAGIENAQYEDMYELLAQISQAAISKEDFIERNRNIYEGIGARNITVTVNRMYEVEDMPGKKIVEYSIRMDTAAGEIAHDQQAVFEINEYNEYRLQWNSHMIFPELGDNDRVRVSILPAQRGQILDRNGEMLAGSGTASSVGFVPGRMRREEVQASIDNIVIDYITIDLDDEVELYESDADTHEIITTYIYNEEDIAKVAELLEMTPEGIIRRLDASYVRDDTFVSLRTISKDAQELIDELLTVQGVMISGIPVRYYPFGRKAAHLVGYIQNINAEELEALRGEGYHMNSVIGRSGLELILEDQLRARDGWEIFIIDGQGNRTATLARKEPMNGRDIPLTIDAYIQSQLYDLFAADRSASVAMNPLTGEVLALVSTPAFDPNDFVRGMTPSIWSALNEDENLPMFNRFRATFSPGSTMKAITASIGVDTGIVNPDEDFGRSGLRWQLNESWGGFFVTTVREYGGPANLNNAMAFSDNIYFAKAALRIGAEAFANGLRHLGFGERIPFDYGLFSSTISRTGTFTSEIQLADSGYGQGEILVNPVHLAAIYAAFVNEGSIIEPWLIYDRHYPSLLWIPDAFAPETARVVLDSLIHSIEYGTGRGARIPGMTLAGKTGTAEIKLTQDDETGTELGWFVLFTADESAENPLLVISMVEDVRGRGGSGYVVPRVRELFTWR